MYYTVRDIDCRMTIAKIVYLIYRRMPKECACARVCVCVGGGGGGGAIQCIY